MDMGGVGGMDGIGDSDTTSEVACQSKLHPITFYLDSPGKILY